MRSCGNRGAALACVAVLAIWVPASAHAQGAKAEYERTLGREEVVRRDLDNGAGVSTPLLRRIRALISEYERVARRHPRSGYSDNALYQAAILSTDAFTQSRDDDDRRAALRLFKALADRYPSSSLIRQTDAYTKRLQAVPKPAPAPAPVATSGPMDHRPILKAIRREALPGALRITLELEQEAAFRDERIDGPPRVFVDLQNTRAVDSLKDATLGFTDDVVRQIRVGRQLGATRVVLDLHEPAGHSVYALYNPYRVVIDFERPTPVLTAAEPPPPSPAPVVPVRPAADTKTAATEPGASWAPESTESSAPAAPAANTKGGFSLSRQLGLGISRVVIDPGHGGHDPGARVKGLNEADVTLDVALRLERLLLKVQGVEVVMTRRTNVYIPLEERTAIANRAGADLFLSIHVNASHNARARGIETYFLNFAPSPEAEAIAARENAGSSKTMHNLPDIVKAIALNNKIDESRDFASLVQTAMFERLRKANRDARNLGVKQAPFMVLIGATMPSVLAEISFLTNRQEASLLKTANYRQAIADALFVGISKYQKALKSAQSVAAQ